MDSETFKTRQQFLENFYSKDRVDFLNAIKNIYVGDFSAHNRFFNGNFTIDTEVIFEKRNINFNNSFKNYPKFLKPLIYFLYSFTFHEKFLNDSVLYLRHLTISYYKRCLNERGKFNACLTFPYLHDNFESLNFLSNIKTDVFIKGINEIQIKLISRYFNIDFIQYLRLGGMMETMEGESEEETEENKKLRSRTIINPSQSFKSEECVICLTNPPNVLFCNCGHQCYCLECEVSRKTDICPICKTENDIIRILE